MSGVANLEAREIAREHCAWARLAGLTPRQVVSAVGRVPPLTCRWAEAINAVAASWAALGRRPRVPPRRRDFVPTTRMSIRR